MILVDDLLVKPFVSLVDILHTMALDEMYDVAAIQDDIKENRLLYELGERSEFEYQQRKADLEAELETAREVHERLRSGKVEVKR